MDPVPVKPWYKKARYAVPLGLAAIALTASAAAGNPATTSVPTVTQTAAVGNFAPANPPQAVIATTPPATDFSNDNYYVNSLGNEVHRPAYTNDNSIPAAASAQCRDGTYSFSQHHSGTCSHHGGVAIWY